MIPAMRKKTMLLCFGDSAPQKRNPEKIKSDFIGPYFVHQTVVCSFSTVKCPALYISWSQFLLKNKFKGTLSKRLIYHMGCVKRIYIFIRFFKISIINIGIGLKNPISVGL